MFLEKGAMFLQLEFSGVKQCFSDGSFSNETLLKMKLFRNRTRHFGWKFLEWSEDFQLELSRIEQGFTDKSVSNEANAF